MSTDYAIFNAAEQNNSKKLKALLDAGMDPNTQDYDRGATPLHFAANKGHVEAIELLIDAGADVNAANKRGRTPMHALIEMKFYKIALWLIKYCGGDPHKADSRGLSAYDLAQGFMQKEIDGMFEWFPMLNMMIE
jgi:ankyrin repeat protein